MTTERQAEANRRNGRLSHGPATPEGKAAASANALRHGVTSSAFVLPGVEREEDWLEHRDGIRAALAPQGALESFLADRVAFCSWRLGRVLRFETATTAKALAESETDIRISLRKICRESERDDAELRDRVAGENMLPADWPLQRVMRYESHLSRQMTQSLHELQRMQAARAGDLVAAPLALDVTVDRESE